MKMVFCRESGTIVVNILHSCTLPLGDVGGGGLSHFSEHSYRRDFGPLPNKFVVVCGCIVIFHGIYSPLPTNIFFFVGGGLIFFSHLVARAWEYFKFPGDLLYWGVLIFFLGEVG